MNITGHNSYWGCRFCNIEGKYSKKFKHTYYPTNENYINRNHLDWIAYINQIEATKTNQEKKALIKQCGKFLFFYYSFIINYK